MKIINEKGKLFGVINVVDLLVLLAAIAVIAGVGYKLFAPQIASVAARPVPMTVTVRVRGATPFLVEEVQRNSQVGKQIVSGSSFTDAVITDMQIEMCIRDRCSTTGCGMQAGRGGRQKRAALELGRAHV